MEEKNKKEKAPLVVVAILIVSLLVCIATLVLRLAGRVSERNSTETQEDKLVVQEMISVTPTEVPKDYILKEVDYEIVYKLHENAFLIWNNGDYGMVNRDGEYLVFSRYEYVEYYDEEWVTFGNSNGSCAVFDTKGNLLADYQFEQQVTVNDTRYWLYTCYLRGMKIEFFIGVEDDSCYGARYYNAENGKLIFEAIGTYEDIAVNSLPDETGTAVVIRCAVGENSIYMITKDGYTEKTVSVEDVEARDFYYSGYNNWIKESMSEGWFRTAVEERRAGMLEFHTDWREILYNIHTDEIVPLPERYQRTYADYYNMHKGQYYGISTLTEEEYYGEYPEVMYYAICQGSKVLTEEIYSWITFDETYILAGNEQFSHIFDYEGNLLAEYEQMGTAFVDGTLIVYDGSSAYLIDETLTKCTQTIAAEVEICQPGFVAFDGKNYLIYRQEE